MQSVFLKGMMVLGSIAGIGCVVAFPIASSNSKNQTISQILKASGEVVKNSCNFYDLWKKEDSIVGQEWDFERLWVEINNRLNKQESCKELSWKEDLKQIFLSILKDNQLSWRIKNTNWNEECSDSHLCGYLELEATKVRKPQSFKIGILKNNSQWKVYVVKWFDNTSLSFKGKEDDHWTIANTVVWNNLEFTADTEWIKIPKASIEQSS